MRRRNLSPAAYATGCRARSGPHSCARWTARGCSRRCVRRSVNGQGSSRCGSSGTQSGAFGCCGLSSTAAHAMRRKRASSPRRIPCRMGHASWRCIWGRMKSSGFSQPTYRSGTTASPSARNAQRPIVLPKRRTAASSATRRPYKHYSRRKAKPTTRKLARSSSDYPRWRWGTTTRRRTRSAGMSNSSAKREPCRPSA